MTSEQTRCPFCGGEMDARHLEYKNEPSHPLTALLCNSCNAFIDLSGRDGESKMRALDDRLMPDGMTWPRWSDGEKVRIGEKMDINDGESFSVVKEVIFRGGHESVLWTDDIGYAHADRHRRYDDVHKDTQERIDADALKEHLDYWGDCEHYAFSCDSCPHSITETGITCRANMILDLLRRQRELDKREAEK